MGACGVLAQDPGASVCQLLRAKVCTSLPCREHQSGHVCVSKALWTGNTRSENSVCSHEGVVLRLMLSYFSCTI